MAFPEVAYAVAKVARADTSTDPAPLNMTETVVHLKPREQWREGMTLDRFARRWLAPFNCQASRPSGRCRSSTASTCSPRYPVRGRRQSVWHRSSCAEESARHIAEVVRAFRARATSTRSRSRAASTQHRIDRSAAARYGIGVGDIQQVIESAVGETVLTMTIEGRERFPRSRRHAPSTRGRAGIGAGSGRLAAGHAGPARPARTSSTRVARP